MKLLLSLSPSNEAKKTISFWRRNATRILETISIPLSSSSSSRNRVAKQSNRNNKNIYSRTTNSTTKTARAAAESKSHKTAEIQLHLRAYKNLFDSVAVSAMHLNTYL